MPLGKPRLNLDWPERIFEVGSGTFGISIVRFEDFLWDLGFHPSGGQWSVSFARTRLVVDWDDEGDLYDE